MMEIMLGNSKSRGKRDIQWKPFWQYPLQVHFPWWFSWFSILINSLCIFSGKGKRTTVNMGWGRMGCVRVGWGGMGCVLGWVIWCCVVLSSVLHCAALGYAGWAVCVVWSIAGRLVIMWKSYLTLFCAVYLYGFIRFHLYGLIYIVLYGMWSYE